MSGSVPQVLGIGPAETFRTRKAVQSTYRPRTSGVENGLKPKPETDPHESMRQRLYEAQCLKCQDNVHAVQQEFDKTILTLAAGLLGISLAFIKDIVPLQLALHLYMLYASWIFAVGAIVLTLASFLASKNAFNAQLDVLYEQHMSPGTEIKPTRAALFTRWLTYGEAAFFLISMLMTIGFAVENVQTIAQHKSSTPAISNGPDTPANRAIPKSLQVPKTVPTGDNVK